MLEIYPRTPHLETSRLQYGDAALVVVPFSRVRGRTLVVEEKLDGANVGISFDANRILRLQSRWRYLEADPGQRQFTSLRGWAEMIASQLYRRLADRYVLYGEWMMAKHTLFYDALPGYFFAFDVMDRRDGDFLGVTARTELLAGSAITMAPVLYAGSLDSIAELTALVAPSRYRTMGWRHALVRAAVSAGAAPGRVLSETDGSDLMEGLYLKVEEGGRVTDRCKWVRPDFLASVLDPDSHWSGRPLLRNQLRDAGAA